MTPELAYLIIDSHRLHLQHADDRHLAIPRGGALCSLALYLANAGYLAFPEGWSEDPSSNVIVEIIHP